MKESTWTAAVVSVGLASATLLAARPGPTSQTAFSRAAVIARTPVAREETYLVNAKVRPLLLFWIARRDIGSARITWRDGPDGRRAFEFLVGSDPHRAPRRINRWGFIVEEVGGSEADVFGIMRESNADSLEEAEAQIAQQADVAVFRGARTTIVGAQAVTGTMTVLAPTSLTYRDLDALLAMAPASPPTVQTTTVPGGAYPGFLVAMDALIHASLEPCSRSSGGEATHVPSVTYLYRRTLYDLRLASCDYEQAMPTGAGGFVDAVDGRFRLRNRTTAKGMNFRVLYGTSGDLRGVPVRAVFQPQWWIEIELELDRPGAQPRSASTGAGM